MKERFIPQEEPEIERLIRLADEGPEIPADGAEMIKDAIRPLWNKEVRRRSRNRRVMWATGLAAAAVVVVVIGLQVVSNKPFSGPGEAVATVARLSGGASDGSAATIIAGAEILAGSRLQTDQSGRVALDLIGGQSFRLDKSTSVRFLSKTSLSLESGAVYIDSGDGHEGVSIHTALGVVTDVGTQFEVRQTMDSMIVRVREGMVLLDRDLDDLEVARGFQVTLGKGGSVARREIRPNSPYWEWTQEIAPLFAVEGRSVKAFLEWIKHETGTEIRYADAETEILAEETILHGSLVEMTPMQAPNFVLPSCGLRSRLDGEFLVVERSAKR